MEGGHAPYTPEEYKHHKKDVMKTTVLLSIVTVVEVVVAILLEKNNSPKWILILFVSAMSLLKAGYIMAVFMHVKHETKGFRYTILVPFSLLIWAIIAFLWEGHSWGAMKGLLNLF